MAWQYDPATGAYYDDADVPIKLSTTESFLPGSAGQSSSWLFWALALLILIAAKKRQ
jgi:hypothetical protein